MATLYITSTANTGTGTLRTLAANATTDDVIQPSPTLFPKGTPCNVSLTSAFGIRAALTIQGAQTRLVITSSSVLSHGFSILLSYVNYADVDFRGFTATSGGAIFSQYCHYLNFLRCSFCGISGYTAPIVLYSKNSLTTTFRDCAFYGNRATENSSGAQGAIYHADNTVAAKTSLINCTFGGNYRNYSTSPRSNWNSTVKEQTNIVYTAAQEAQWKTPPASTYGYSTWTATSYQTMDPRPSATASWRTGATQTSSTIDLDGNPRKSGGALGAWEFPPYGQLATPANFRVTAATATSLTLGWDAVEKAESYSITYGTTTRTTTGTSLEITGLTTGTSYTFSIVATAEDYTDSDPATCSGTPQQKTALMTPMVLPNATSSAAGLTVSWGTVDSNAVGFRVNLYAGSSPSGTPIATQTISGTTSTTIGGTLTYNATYCVGVIALAPEGSPYYYDSGEGHRAFTYDYQAHQIAPFDSSTLLVQDKDGLGNDELQTGTDWVRVVYKNDDPYLEYVQFRYRVANGTWSQWYNSGDSSYENVKFGGYSSGYWSGWYWVNITGLTSGTTYELVAQAFGDSSCLPSVVSDAVTFTTRIQLATPTITSASATSNSITVSWSAVTNAQKYAVDIRLGDASWVRTVVGDTSYTIPNLTSGTYEIRVQALSTSDLYSNSDVSPSVYVTTLTKLDAPTGLAASNITETTSTLSWNAVTNASGYTVKWRQKGTTTWTTDEESMATSLNLTGLTAATEYEFLVIAKGDGTIYADSDASTTAEWTTQTRLATPTVTLTRTTSSFTASWSAISHATSYVIEYKLSTASSWTSTTSTTTTKTISSLTSGATYNVRVKAVSTDAAYSESSYSTEQSVVIQTQLTTPSPTYGSTVSSITASWTAIPNASSYKVFYKLKSASTYSSDTVTTTSWSKGSLTSGSVYTCYVQAIGSGDYTNSGSSTATDVTVKTQLATPVIQSVERTTTTLTPTWGAVSNRTSYTLQYRLASASTWTTETGITTTSYQLTGLAEGATYKFQVMAVGSGNYTNSAYSDVVEQRTQTKLATPTGLAVSNLLSTSATLSWNAVANATSYLLTISDANGAIAGYDNKSVSGTSIDVTGLSTTKEYTVELVAVSTSTDYVNSTAATLVFTTDTKLGTPGAPTLTAGTNSITATWGSVSAADYYYVAYKESSATSFTEVKISTGRTYTLSSLNEGATYTFKVRACSNNEEYEDGDYSETSSTTTLRKLATPTGLTATNITETTATLSWNAVTNASGYTVKWRETGAANWTTVNVD